MRNLFISALALSVVTCAAPQAAAEQTPDGGDAPRRASARAASALVDAAIPAIVERAEATLPALKASLRETPGYAEMPQDMRARIEAYVDTFPELLRRAMKDQPTLSDSVVLPEEVRAQIAEALEDTPEGRRGELDRPAPDVHGSVAAMLEARFSARDLSQLADFLETPAGAAVSRHAAQATAQRISPDFATLPAHVRSEFERFAATRTGQVYVREAGALGAVVEELLRLVSVSRGREFMENIGAQICAIAGAERCAQLGR